MSDVTVAPAATPAASTPAAAPTPVAPRNEVQINQNPVGTPNPVPPQVPPAEDKPRPETRREGIQRALNKHRTEHPVAPPREAKKGDNAPPEDTPDDFTLKKRPGDQAAKIDQPREKGRFAPKTTPDGQAQPNVGAQAGQPTARPGTSAAPQPYRPPPGAPAHHHPLPRMSPRAAAAWDKVPDEVRADAHRMYREVDQAFRKYKGAHDLVQTIAPYVKMAHEQGTSLDKVLANHVAIEDKLRSDPIGAFEVITHNLNLQTPDGQKLGFRDLCWHALNQTPEQQQLIAQRNEAQATRLQLEAMRREQQALVNEMRRAQYVQHFQTTRGAVDQYADQRPRFDELGDLIHREIQLGFSLDEAYRRAELLRPGTTAAQTRQTTPAQTRTPDRSISGAPSGGLNGANGARTGKPVSRKDALEHAFRHHRSV
jgi:hypothetical protein